MACSDARLALSREHLITGGGLGIWWLVDIFTADGRTKNYNLRVFNEALQNAQLVLPRD